MFGVHMVTHMWLLSGGGRGGGLGWVGYRMSGVNCCCQILGWKLADLVLLEN